MRIAFFITLFSSLFFKLHAQDIQGKVFGKDGAGERIVLKGASIKWMDTDIGSTSDENGAFRIGRNSTGSNKIIFTYTGFKADTLVWNGKSYISVELRNLDNTLEEVEVKGRTSPYVNSAIAKTEVIGIKELSKAACCDLAGCFGTQASVQAHPTNAVTNAQELRLLGISGVYNQVLFEGMPMIQGLSYTYGISTYPGSLVEAIHISKGTTSVLQGFESISGQINVDGRKPATAEKLFLNVYTNSFLEKHLNANVAWGLGKDKHWKSILALHTVQPGNRVDNNDDNFLDIPLLTRYMAYNKWEYNNGNSTGLTAQLGWRFVHENRIGGQKDFRPSRDQGSLSIYGQDVTFTQPEFFAKVGYRLNDKSAIQATFSGLYHDQESWFGSLRYRGKQWSAQANVQHEWKWMKGNELKYGVSYRLQEIDENILLTDPNDTRTYAGDYSTRLRVPGFFAENMFESNDGKLSLITGLRMDHHQKYGWYLTPRAMAKYSINENHTTRGSIGTGWRQVNLFSEQVNLLASSRDIIFKEDLEPEKATTWGLSHTWTFWAGSSNFTFSGDFYQTLFSNQFFPDYDTDPTKAYINNFTKDSKSNGVQLEGSVQFVSGLEVRAAYNYLDVYRDENGGKYRLPFNPKNRVMLAASYVTPNEMWQFDANAHWFDRMYLPNTESNPEPYRRPSMSTPYSVVNLQTTVKLGKFDIYAGCENVANYKQKNAIIGADNPFGPYFDISSVWGPIRGREFYLGARFKLK